jgi:hypothetical protein
MCSLVAFPVPAARYKPRRPRWALRVTLEPGTTAMTHIGKWNTSAARVSAGWRRSAMNNTPPDSRRKGPQ